MSVRIKPFDAAAGTHEVVDGAGAHVGYYASFMLALRAARAVARPLGLLDVTEETGTGVNLRWSVIGSEDFEGKDVQEVTPEAAAGDKQVHALPEKSGEGVE